MNQQETYELIEAYLQHTLSSADALQFEKRLETDPEFAQEFELHQQLQEEYSPSPLNEFRDLLRAEASVKPEVKMRTIGLRSVISIAASIALIVTIGFLYFANQKTAPGDLFASYIDQPTLNFDGVERGDEPVNFNILAEQIETANVFYQNQQFESAIEVLEKLDRKLYEGHEDAVNFRIGLYSLLNNDAQGAINYFDKIKDVGESARWYKGLAYLKLGDKEEARNLLQPLATYDNPKKANAVDILKNLQ